MANHNQTASNPPVSNNQSRREQTDNSSSNQTPSQPNSTAAAGQPSQTTTAVSESSQTNQQPTPGKSKTAPTKSNRKPLGYYLPIFTIILAAILITQLLLITIFSNHVQQQVTDQAIKERQQTDHTLAQAALADYQSDIKKLALSFPDLEGIREFAQTLNQQLDQFPEKGFDISTNEPVQTQELFAPLIPVSISVTATPSAFTPIMKKLSASHYLFQPVYLEVNALEGLSSLGMIDYRGNLFVSKELIKSN